MQPPLADISNKVVVLGQVYWGVAGQQPVDESGKPEVYTLPVFPPFF
jgi:hypothetical protein